MAIPMLSSYDTVRVSGLRGNMRRDVLIIVALDTMMVLLGWAYLWLIHHVFTGMGAIPVALLWGFIAIIFTAMAGLFLKRLWVGALGILLLWTGFSLHDWLTSLATFAGVITAASFHAAVQFVVMLLAWLFGFLIRR